MGIINQAAGLGKSYGVYGSSTDSATNLSQSYVQNAADMTSANTNTKYIIVSLLPESAGTVDQGTTVFAIQFQASAWSTELTGWTAPATPTAPVAATIPTKKTGSKYLSVAAAVTLASMYMNM